MQKYVFFPLLLIGLPAFALGTSFQYACLGIDGVPIASDSAQAALCCQNESLSSNPPATCRAGFGSIGALAEAGAGIGVHIAQQTLDTARDLNGVRTNLTPPKSGGEGGPPRPQNPTTSAITSGSTGSANDGTGKDGTGGSKLGADSAGGYHAGSKSGGSNGGSEPSLGTTHTSANKSNSDSADSGPGSAGGYVSANGANGAGEKNGAGGFGNLFGKDGASGGIKGDGAESELKFGDENGADGKNGPGEIQGTTVDPSDYFKRIDKTASLFKIVTKRYTQETGRKHVGQ